jgi:hypothetical protein
VAILFPLQTAVACAMFFFRALILLLVLIDVDLDKEYLSTSSLTCARIMEVRVLD